MPVSAETIARPSVAKPTLAFCAAERLRTSNPAVTSSTMVTAICPTTSTSRIVHRSRRAAARPALSPLRSQTRLARVARSAGARPASTPVKSAMPAVKPRTRASSRRSSDSAIGIGSWNVVSSRVSQEASRRRPPAPSTPRIEAFCQELTNEPPPRGARRRDGWQSRAGGRPRARAASRPRSRTR